MTLNSEYPYTGGFYGGYSDPANDKKKTFIGPNTDKSLSGGLNALATDVKQSYGSFSNGVQDTLGKISAAYKQGGLSSAAGQYVRGTIADTANALKQGVGKPIMNTVVKPVNNLARGAIGLVGEAAKGTANFGHTLVTGNPAPVFGGQQQSSTTQAVTQPSAKQVNPLANLTPKVNTPSSYSFSGQPKEQPTPAAHQVNLLAANTPRGSRNIEQSINGVTQHDLDVANNFTSGQISDHYRDLIRREGVDAARRSPSPNEAHYLTKGDNGKYSVVEIINGFGEGTNRSRARFEQTNPELAERLRASRIGNASGAAELERKNMVNNWVKIATDPKYAGKAEQQQAVASLELMGVFGNGKTADKPKYVTTKEEDMMGGKRERVYQVNSNGTMDEVRPNITSADIARQKALLSSMKEGERKSYLQNLAQRDPFLFDALRASYQ